MRWSLFFIGALALGAGGCAQTTTQAVVAEPVVTAPIVLNSAAAAPPAPTALAPSAPAPAGTVAATGPVPATAVAVPVAPAPQPVAVAPAPVAAAQPEPLPTAAPSASGQFPNINQVPTQPAGTLLPETERARIIAELEALRAGQTAPDAAGGGGASDLAQQAQTHGDAAIKQIETCSQEGALQSNPDCAPAD